MANNEFRTHNLSDDYQTVLDRTVKVIVPAILDRDPSIWSKDADAHKSIANRLGWLDSPNWSAERVAAVQDYAANVRADGLTDIVLLGMGGSSLAPEVCRDVFATDGATARLHVLDNTHPDAVRAVESAVDFAKSLFIVASKSGGTTETSCFQKYFYAQAAKSGIDASRHFCAITDPGSALADAAVSKRYRERFLNPADIGGRYSAISYFGLVPAACAGVDIKSLVERAVAEVNTFTDREPAPVAAQLGAALGASFSAGKDKLTLLYSDAIAPLGVWVEQLVAESTGKLGVGIVPVVDEALHEPAMYDADRLFVVTALDGDQQMADRVKALVDAGHAVVEYKVADAMAIGSEFVRWEMATAIAGAIMSMTESKNKTRALLEGDGRKSIADGELGAQDIEALIDTLCSRSATGDYLALLAYVGETARFEPLLEALRLGLGKRLKVATTLGYGPRFLHSTGQLHKGGAANGHFLQLVAAASDDLDVPEEPYSFGELNHCQALGDYQVLLERERRVSRVNLGAEPLVTLAQLVEKVG